jgi:hypothetical protein
MKKNLTIAVLLLSLSVSAQKDTTAKNPLQVSDSTGFGQADGNLVSKEIGIDGGRVASDDGMVELIFPSGALKANTKISIQPITNLAPNGSGKAYQFSPDGIQFAKPVQLIIRYTDEEADECPPDLMGFAWQDHTGKWRAFDYENLDSIGKTLQVSISHFSFYTKLKNLALRIDDDVVSTKGYTRFTIIDATRVYDNTISIMAGENRPGRIDPNAPVIWYANGVENGNTSTGTIERDTHASPHLKFAFYRGPDYMPGTNPVVIAVRIFAYSKKTKSFNLARVLKGKIKIYDRYSIKVEHQYMGRLSLKSEIVDSARFKIYVYPNRVQIADIQNYAPIVIKEGQNGVFKEKVFVDGAQGTIDITPDYSDLKITKASPPEVYFTFKPRELLMCKIKHGAKGIWGETSELPYLSLPEEINFIANGQPQVYNVTHGGRGENYKLIVTPIR